MKDKVCLITGSNSGIGYATTSALAEMDATVVMAVRNRKRGEIARSNIVEKTRNEKLEIMICDVSSKYSISAFVKEFSENYNRLDVLINNAGAVFSKRKTTEDGFERSFAVNYLGPFQLTYKLLPILKSSSPSRVINVSSGMHKTGKINFEDLQRNQNYNEMQVYADTKLMVTTITYEWAQRLEGTGVSVNVVEPGFVATNLGRNSGSIISRLSFGLMRFIQVSPEKGAETSVYMASSNEVEGVTGKCYAKLKETTTSKMSYDTATQKRLWNTTLKLLDINNAII